MDLEYGPRYQEFRREVRAFVDAHKPKKPLGNLAREGRAELVRWLSLQIEHGYWARTMCPSVGAPGATGRTQGHRISQLQFSKYSPFRLHFSEVVILLLSRVDSHSGDGIH